MSWYNIFASFYDALDSVYRPQREQAARALDLSAGQRVLEIACGTGQSFPSIIRRIGPAGVLVGVDLSAGMLARARKRSEAKGWQNIELLARDAAKLERRDVTAALDGQLPQRVLSFLALTVIPGWQDAFDASYELLEAGGRYVIVDVFNDRPGAYGRYINFVARSDISRPVWQPLEARCRGFELRRFRAHWSHGGDIVIATGIKP